jgi:hypothetical protein
MRHKKKGFEFGYVSIRFTHPVITKNENKSGNED